MNTNDIVFKICLALVFMGSAFACLVAAIVLLPSAWCLVPVSIGIVVCLAGLTWVEDA